MIVISQVALAAGSDDRQNGHDHFYNLEYDEAINAFAKVIKRNPADPISYNDLARAELCRELCRLSLFDVGKLGSDNRFLRDRPVLADPTVKARFLDTLDRGQHEAENILAHDRRNETALYSLCTAYALRSTYDFMLDKVWLSALRHGSQARGYCDELRKINPAFIDAYLVLGVFEYATGSLPSPVKRFVAIGGLHGSKNKGIEYISRVAQQGKYDRDAARALLIVLWRKEKRPQQATQVLEGLITDYPRNYLFGLELSRVYTDAGQPEQALTVLKRLLQNNLPDVASHQRPIRDIVQKQIDALEAKVSSWQRDNTTRVWP
jgi:tetratricopeptide (TPR) repeat protein